MSSSSHNLAYVPGPTFGFVKLLASSGSHCTKWADEQHRPAGFESWLVPDLPLPFIPTLIGLRAFNHVSSPVWWEAATNKQRSLQTFSKPMYGTRPCCLVQAITWHTCPGPTFGFVKLLASSGSHCPKWADEQHRPAGFESARSRSSPPLYPYFNRPLGFWPCVKSYLVEGSDK